MKKPSQQAAKGRTRSEGLRRTSFLRELAGRIPHAWLAALAFAAFIGFGLLLSAIVPPKAEPVAQCDQQCLPRKGRLENDKDYPMSAKSQYRQICRCHW